MSEFGENSQNSGTDHETADSNVKESSNEISSPQNTTSKDADHSTERDTEIAWLAPDEIRELPVEEYSSYLQRIAFGCRDYDLIAEYIPVIADRFDADLRITKEDSLEKSFAAHKIGQMTRFIFQGLAGNPEITLDKDILERFYQFKDDPHIQISHHACENLVNLMYFDNRVQGTEEFLDLTERFKYDTASRLANYKDGYNLETATNMVEVAWGDYPNALPEILVRAMSMAPDEDTVKIILNRLGNRLGFEKMMVILHSQAVGNPEFQEKLDLVEGVLRHSSGMTNIDIDEFYNKFNIEGHAVTEEITQFEKDILSEEVEQDEEVLEIATGAGRLIQAMKEQGVRVVGFDYVKKNVEAVKRADPESNVVVGSWDKMPYADESFDVAYCFGRSFLHNRTVTDARHFLQEARRVLKNGGKLLLDLPDSTKGHYDAESAALTEAAQALGILYKEEGSLHDSPDGVQYMYRFAPQDSQFVAWSRLAGFEVEKIVEKTYKDLEGHENTNIYWKLTKTDKKPSSEEVSELLNNISTTAPPIFFKLM